MNMNDKRQVSQQAVQMLWDGLLDERKAEPTQAVPTTRLVDVRLL